jgi:hypothetical protein
VISKATYTGKIFLNTYVPRMMVTKRRRRVMRTERRMMEGMVRRMAAVMERRSPSPGG